MKRFAAALVTLFFVAPAFAQVPDPPLVKAARADLDGDKKPDAVSVTSGLVNDSVRFTLTVNGAKLSVSPKNYLTRAPGFQVLTLGDAARKYIAVWLEGETDDQEVRFFRYDGMAIRAAGVVPGRTQTKNGIVYATWWMGFWECKAKYAPGADGILRFVPQAAYFVGKSGTVKTSFAVRVSPAKTAAVVANVAPGSRVELLLFRPYDPASVPRGCEGGYYLIKTQTGLCGWADYKVFKDKIPDLPFAG